MSRGHRASLYSDIIVPFPPGLMNTAQSPVLINSGKFARHIENILPNGNKAGSGSKRYGFGKKGDAIASVESLAAWEYRNATGALEVLKYFSDGTIRRLNGDGSYTTLISGLAGVCVPGALAFNGKLIIWNGVNPLHAYDGATIETVKEWVLDTFSDNATQGDQNTFTIEPIASRNDYVPGRRVLVTFETAGDVIATIDSVSGTTTLTVNVVGTPFPSPGETIVSVAYEMAAPALSFVYAEHDALWGLSAGVPHPDTFRGEDGLKVFFTEELNSEASWYNQLGDEPTQELNFINLAGKARKFDELVSISSIDGLMCFHGRLQCYVFAGSDPTAEGDFAWQKTIPVGCVNGNLVIRFPGDTLFVTRYGARSLRSVLEQGNLEANADLGTNVDPTVTAAVKLMMQSAEAYRAARSFFYENDGFYGFKLAGNYMLAYVLSEESKGWVFLSGLFKDATCFLSTSDGRLLIGKSGQLYAYGNGTDATVGTTFGDDGQNIFICWWLPWLSKQNKRWGNRYFEVIVEQTTTTTLSVFRAVDYNDNTVKQSGAAIELTEDSALWDEAMWDDALWDGTPKRVLVRDKFLCNAFWAQIQNNSTEGPISILGFRPIGK